MISDQGQEVALIQRWRIIDISISKIRYVGIIVVHNDIPNSD